MGNGPSDVQFPMTLIVHIATRAMWEKAGSRGVYEPPSLKSQGYIHCSYPYQLVEVANFLYKGRMDLVLLLVETSKVQSRIREEIPKKGSKAYPHIYGPLNLDAVTGVLEFRPDREGLFQLPPVLAYSLRPK